jgi:hypothetical protein
MNESRDDITNEPPRREDGIAEQPAAPAHGYDYPVDVATVLQQRKKKRLLLFLGVGVGIAILGLLTGQAITFVAKVHEAADRTQSMNNLKQMTIAMNNIASNTTTNDIPPAYGAFPVGSSQSRSFFTHLLPYIIPSVPYGFYDTNSQMSFPVQTYIAAADSRNPQTNSTISYCSNATVLNGHPRLPGSFNGRIATIICVMERSGLDGAHTWSNQNSYLGAPGTSPPFPQIGVDPAAYLDGSPQAFVSAGCLVGFGDASVRLVTKTQSNGWNWACDPALTGPTPSDW